MSRLGKNTSIVASKEQNEDEVKNVKDFTRKSQLDDFEFIVEDKSLHVSKLILTLVSSVFQRMFQSEFQESHESRLELPGKSFDLFHQFLKSIYPCGLGVVTEENVFDILPLAEEYQVLELKSKCATCLLRIIGNCLNQASITQLFRVLEAASLYSFEEVIDRCSKCIAERRMKHKEMIKVESGFSIPPETKIILRNKVILCMGPWAFFSF